MSKKEECPMLSVIPEFFSVLVYTGVDNFA